MTVAQILENKPEAAVDAGRQQRAKWPQKAVNAVKQWENKGARVEGYLLKVKQDGPSLCNCHAREHRDFHIWLAAAEDDDRSSAVVVEVLRTQDQHEAWRLRILSRLAKDKAKVRISGWLMWDQEHPDQIGQTRGTLWEIHPIHKIEVYSGGQWREL